jgi:hypothetical protein
VDHVGATYMLLWVLPEFFRSSRGGSDVALMRFGAKCDGWAEASGVSARLVLVGS